MKKVDILGIPFDAMSVNEALDLLESYLNESHNHIVVTPNPEGVMQAQRNPAFREALLAADLRLADGIGIVLASRYLRNPIHTRVRGVDTIYALLERLTTKGQKHTAYFLGGAPGVALKAKLEMESRFPALSVVGHHHGYFNADEEAVILDELNRLKPDIMLVCTGMPRAEIWATKHRDIPARITLCLGGTLDVMSGNAKLPPPIVRKLGLEWLYRLLRQSKPVKGQPSRIKRQLDIPRFVFAVLRSCRKRGN
ncbi:MAG: WecB/TagA/CpsF family glycosyltransferase [Defluviitaleaceae bacterium]|nr:WecB/TagA/CpsF family glycosyltransferase [Defluviitaleaceae bacterium]